MRQWLDGKEQPLIMNARACNTTTSRMPAQRDVLHVLTHKGHARACPAMASGHGNNEA